MEAQHDEADTLIVLARGQASLYEFVRPRQEAAGRTLVVLERRHGERRGIARDSGPDRRHRERRARTPEAALALMSVLGFMILHRHGDRWMP